MTTILSLIPWWEPVLITLAILAVVFEKRLIVFENQLGHAIARLWRKHARKKAMR